MNPPLNIAQYFVLSIVGIMAVAYVLILIFNLSDKKPKPMMLEKSCLVFWLAALGLPTFLLGLVLVFFPRFGHTNLGIELVAGGFLALFGSTFLNAAVAKSKRTAWPVVNARCTERQLLTKKFSNGDGSADGWLWRLVCEVNYGGKHCVVSPKVNWSDLGQVDAPFWSEEKAQRFLSEKISSDGKCKLRINPDNPLEAELL